MKSVLIPRRGGTEVVPEYLKTEVLVKKGIEFFETTDLEASMPQLDISYMTRVQERKIF